MTSPIEVQGDLTRLLKRPVATALAVATLPPWLWPPLRRLRAGRWRAPGGG